MRNFKKKYKNKKFNLISLCSLVVAACVIFLTLGYSAFQASLQISDIGAVIRVQKDIRITGIKASTSTSNAYHNWEDYNVRNITASITLPKSDSTMTYDVEITNIGNAEMGILSITGLPSNLTYSISNYTLKETLCDDTDNTKCKLGSVSTLHITIGYASNGYNSNSTTYNIDMKFEFKQAYKITYSGFSNVTGLPTTILMDDTKTITFNNTTHIPVDVSVNNAIGSYTSPTLTISGATGNVTIIRKYAVTYVDFPGDTSGLVSTIGPSGGTIGFNSITGIPEMLTVTGANNSYNTTNHILTLTNVTSNVTITMLQDGDVEIVSVTRQDILNVTENSNPQIANDGQGISFDLSVVVDQSNSDQDFYVTYAIVINNDSVHEQKVLATNFAPNITGTGNLPNVTYNITDTNGNQVLNTVIPPKSSATYYLTINIDPQEEGTWGVNGETSVDTVENGNITASISGSNQGNLTGSNTTAHFTASVTNAYDEAKNFIFSIDDSKFSIVDSNGSAISSMNIAANTTATYDFYIKNINGNNFTSSPYGLNVSINHDSKTSSIGVVSLAVDIDPSLIDNTPPVINNVTATITNVEKEILVSWSGTDDSTITNYYVETYTSDLSGNGSLYHTETLSGAANGVTVNYTATVPNDDAYYYFKVYAKDSAKNIASASDISSCSTSSGHCMKAENKKYKWNFIVKLILTNAASSKGTTTTSGNVNTVTFNAFYDTNIDTVLSGGSDNYNPPSSISSATITPAGGSAGTLSSGSSSQTAYSYSTRTYTLNVYHITGDIEIRASGSEKSCLAEGTKILMADGSYKNVENIDYDDLIAVWNYDTGELTYEYPLWIENEHVTDEIIRVTFDDKSYIDFVGDHATYSTDKNLFVNILDKDNFKVGTHVAKLKNNKLVNATVTKIEKINKKVKYYFIGSTTYYNVFANNILTTDHNLMISNLYGFDNNAKWPKQKEQILSDQNNLLDYSDFKDVLPYYLYKGFRVQEAGYLINNNITDLNTFKKYITSLIINPEMVKTPITINNDRYWMITTSEDIVSSSNKATFLRKEGSVYTLPKSNKYNFKGWYNTTDNSIYQPGDKIFVSHGIHLKAIYDTNKSHNLKIYTCNDNNTYFSFKKPFTWY